MTTEKASTIPKAFFELQQGNLKDSDFLIEIRFIELVTNLIRIFVPRKRGFLYFCLYFLYLRRIVGMVKVNFRTKISVIIAVNFLLLGSFGIYVNIINVVNLSDKTTNYFQRLYSESLQSSTNELTSKLTQESLAIQSSGIIFEDSEDFMEGNMDHLIVSDSIYLTLDEETAWTNITSAKKCPSARLGLSMVYATNSDKVILFGGFNSTSSLTDTWVYDLITDTWTEMNPAINPSGRDGTSMIYDSESESVILFGGLYIAYFDDMWVYNLSTNTWTEISLINPPSARFHHSMVYDSNSNKVILFGGAQAGVVFDDTWVYDYLTNTWTEMIPLTKPSARYGHSMVYDSNNNKIILFGGYNYSSYYDDTWVYDLSTNTWAEMDSSIKPSKGYHYKMVYDSNSNKVILFGGYISSSGLCDETWTYDLVTNTWMKMAPVTKPSARYRHGMVYNSKFNKIVLFGGFPLYLNDTWIYPYNKYYQSGIFESKLTSFGTVCRISGEIEWDPLIQPLDTELEIQIGLSNTSQDEDFHYTAYHNSSFFFEGSAQYLRYRARFESDVNQSSSSILKQVCIYFLAEKPVASIPSAPLNLVATIGDQSVALSWSSPDDDGGSPITRYNVYRGTRAGEYMFLGISTSTNFNDTLLLGGMTYYYMVTAVNAVGESDFSNEVSATPTGATVPKSGPFPSFFFVLVFLGALVLVTRKTRKS